MLSWSILPEKRVGSRLRYRLVQEDGIVEEGRVFPGGDLASQHQDGFLATHLAGMDITQDEDRQAGSKVLRRCGGFRDTISRGIFATLGRKSQASKSHVGRLIRQGSTQIAHLVVRRRGKIVSFFQPHTEAALASPVPSRCIPTAACC